MKQLFIFLFILILFTYCKKEKNISNNESNITDSITEKPKADFIVKDSCQYINDTIQFYDKSTNYPSEYYWEFEGADLKFSNSKNPKVVYNKTGKYNVSLKVSNKLGVDSILKVKYIDVTYNPFDSVHYKIKPSQVVHCPNDNILYKFDIEPYGGTAPYKIKWNLPDTLIGYGSFSFWLKKDLMLNFEITDSKSNTFSFEHIIKINEIDSLQFDYRNEIIGIYKCLVDKWWYSYVNGAWQYNTSQTIENIKVEKDNDFRYVKIGYYSCIFYYKTKIFDIKIPFPVDLKGLYYQGYFKEDSIFLNEAHSHGNWANTYKGEKIK